MSAALINQILGFLTIVAQALVLVVLVASFTAAGRAKIKAIIGEKGMFYAFIVALVATLGSLTYSEVLGYEPCELCWFQRILMYPEVILLGMGLIKKDKNIIGYSFVLAVIGGVIAGYHYLLQLGLAPSLPCSAVGYSANCSARFVLQYGYITIPLMALSAFALIGALLYFETESKRA